MNSIFSDYLTPLGVFNEDAKPSEIYDQLRNAYNQGVKGIMFTTRAFASFENDKEDCDIIYEIWRNSYLRYLLKWSNIKIVLQLGLMDYRTIGVRLRIFTGMLNNLVDEKLLSKQIALRIHDNFVTTINREMSAINTEDLPF